MSILVFKDICDLLGVLKHIIYLYTQLQSEVRIEIKIETVIDR